VTYTQSIAGASKTFRDDATEAAHAAGMAVRTGRGELIVAYAEVRNAAEVGPAQAVADRLGEWHSQIEQAGDPLLGEHRYLMFYPVHAAALDSLVLRWYGSLEAAFGPLDAALTDLAEGRLDEALAHTGEFVTTNGTIILDGTQFTLDVAGLIPGIGFVADVLNAGISGLRGNFGEAALNLGAAIPGLGQGVTAAKFATAGVPLAAKIIDKTDDAADLVRAGDKVADGLQGYKRAGEFGIERYGSLQRKLRGTGLQAHHLVERRFADALDVNHRDIPAIALTRGEHQPITNAFRQAIPYGTQVRELTQARIMKEARRIYREQPALLKALDEVFGL